MAMCNCRHCTELYVLGQAQHAKSADEIALVPLDTHDLTAQPTQVERAALLAADEIADQFAPGLFDAAMVSHVAAIVAKHYQAANMSGHTPATGVYSADPLACSGCVSGCLRCAPDHVEGARDMVSVPRELLTAASRGDPSLGANAIILVAAWDAMAAIRALLAGGDQ